MKKYSEKTSKYYQEQKQPDKSICDLLFGYKDEKYQHSYQLVNVESQIAIKLIEDNTYHFSKLLSSVYQLFSENTHNQKLYEYIFKFHDYAYVEMSTQLVNEITNTDLLIDILTKSPADQGGDTAVGAISETQDAFSIMGSFYSEELKKKIFKIELFGNEALISEYSNYYSSIEGNNLKHSSGLNT